MNKRFSLKRIIDLVESVDAGAYCLGEKIAYLNGYINAARGLLEPEADEYLVNILCNLSIVCNGGIIANVPIAARGRFDIKPYRALELIPAGACLRKEG